MLNQGSRSRVWNFSRLGGRPNRTQQQVATHDLPLNHDPHVWFASQSLLRNGASDGNLRLRPANDDDRELLTSWFSDPAVSVPWCGVVLSEAEITKRFARIEPVTEHGGSYIAIEGVEPVGYLAYDPSFDDVSVHIVLIPSARRRGLGSRALRLLGDLLIAALEPTRLVGSPTPDNHAVIRALRSAGFTQPDPDWALFERLPG